MSNKIRFKAIIALLFFCFAALIMDACKRKKTPPANAEINAAFENAPPIASDITITILDKPITEGNVLLQARFDSSLIKERFHAIMVNDEKLVFRDDGEGGDAKAGDHIFSIVLQEDIQQFRNDLAAQAKKLQNILAKQKQLFKFVNRSPVPITIEISRFLASPFDTSRIIRLPPDIFLATEPDPLLNDRSLMITNIGTIEDPSRTFNPCTGIGNPVGAWTFGKLMADMANSTVTPENFVRAWLDTWMTTQTVNSDNIPARTTIFNSIIRPWIVRSNPGINPASITLANWKTKTLQLKFAPFRLLAIVNRVDLRGNSGYNISNAGEGRFVFGALNNNCQPLTGPGKFAVIFEYAVPKKTCASLKAFAQSWYDLKNLTPGDAAYNAALQAITDQFAGAGKGGSRPNGSSLNQVRTNELALGDPWELREFNIDATSHTLKLVTVKQEPAKIFNRLASPSATLARQTTLASFINANEPAVLNNTYSVPELFPGTAFLGAKAHTENTAHFWDASTSAGSAFITNNTARHVFSIGTCSGCHGGEGKTSVGNLINDPAGAFHNPFLHITPQPFGVKPTLSAFLTGDPAQADAFFRVADPASRPTGSPSVWSFNDLARRNLDLQNLVQHPCFKRLPEVIRELTFKPVHMTH